MDGPQNEAQLVGPRVLLGVCGGIAAYKSADLVRRLRERGAEVRVVLTRAAASFVGPLTFQAVSGQPVRSELLDEAAEAGMGHIELARWADRVLIAPATADVIARLAAGLADDLLTTVCLATTAPVAIAPAMNARMWANPATVDNVVCLERRGVRILGPATGEQACGETGAGRMLEPDVIADLALAPPAGLAGLAGVRALVTAGPTREPLDPVRFLGNRSSGKMGFAVAGALALAGARVTLVSGPVSLPTPHAVAHRIDVGTAREMHAAVLREVSACDIFVGAAAVADFRPAEAAGQKIKKGTRERMVVELVRNPDILAAVASRADGPFTVGFAAETGDLVAEARRKLTSKGLDMIAANRVGELDTGFDSDDNALTVLHGDQVVELERASKLVVAGRLVRLIAQCYAERA